MRVRGDFSRNNLDCLRLILASIVVLFHLYALTNIAAFSAFGYILLPHFAIRSFFVISGFLVYRSYTRSNAAGQRSAVREPCVRIARSSRYRAYTQ